MDGQVGRCGRRWIPAGFVSTAILALRREIHLGALRSLPEAVDSSLQGTRCNTSRIRQRPGSAGETALDLAQGADCRDGEARLPGRGAGCCGDLGRAGGVYQVSGEYAMLEGCRGQRVDRPAGGDPEPLITGCVRGRRGHHRDLRPWKPPAGSRSGSQDAGVDGRCTAYAGKPSFDESWSADARPSAVAVTAPLLAAPVLTASAPAQAAKHCG